MSSVIHLSAHLSCSTLDAFAFLTEPSKLTTWLALDARVEPQVGGAYELFWDLDDRTVDSTLGCVLTAFVPGQMLAFSWRSPRQFAAFANQADPLTHVVVSVHEGELGATVHLIHSGWRSTPQWQEARQWQARAWGMALGALKEAVGDGVV